MVQDFSYKTKSNEIYFHECVQEGSENDSH